MDNIIKHFEDRMRVLVKEEHACPNFHPKDDGAKGTFLHNIIGNYNGPVINNTNSDWPFLEFKGVFKNTWIHLAGYQDHTKNLYNETIKKIEHNLALIDYDIIDERLLKILKVTLYSKLIRNNYAMNLSTNKRIKSSGKKETIHTIKKSIIPSVYEKKRVIYDIS